MCNSVFAANVCFPPSGIGVRSIVFSGNGGNTGRWLREKPSCMGLMQHRDAV